MCPVTCTRSPSRSGATGRGCARRRRRSTPTCDDVARAYGIDRLVQTDTTVTACAWDAERCRWSVETAGGPSHEADALILATGQLDQPSRPQIEGATQFAGHSFHSAEWDHDYPLAGKRVAVIGTGASAVQFVPEIAPVVERLTRLPTHRQLVPATAQPPLQPGDKNGDRTRPRPAGAAAQVRVRVHRVADAGDPPPAHVGRLAAARSAGFMRSQLKDRALREKAWPDYTFGCKRDPLQLALPARAGATERRAGHRRDRAHHAHRDRDRGRRGARARLPDLGDRLQDHRLHVPDARHRQRRRRAARVLVAGRARAPRHLRAGLPQHVRHVRTQHEHLRAARSSSTWRRRRATSARPWSSCARARPARSRCAPRSRPPATASCRRASRVPRGCSATPGTATRTAGSSPTGPDTCASTSSGPRDWTQPSTASRHCQSQPPS